MIEFRGVNKLFVDGDGNTTVAIRSLDLRIETGETHCLIGTSGCGKTTTLRLVNRLEDPTEGQVLLAGVDVRSRDVYELRRSIGYVIQTGGLFPHLTVAQNVGILCQLEGRDRQHIDKRTAELLRLVNLPMQEFGSRFPSELSGGQRQRVGIARALALDPDYLLMDEPFGALDPITRSQVHQELRPLFAAMDKTVLLVTHDLGEAFQLGHRISLMDRGELVQTGTPDELRRAPRNDFVADFVAAQAGER